MGSKGSIVLVEIEPPYEAAIGRQASAAGWDVVRAGGDISALIDGSHADVCVVYIRSSDVDAVQRIRLHRKQLGERPLVVLGERLGSDLTLRLVRCGANDVIEVPAPSEDVAARILALHVPPYRPASPIIGVSESIGEVREKITALARTRATVLLQGETGTGKGLVARSIHDFAPWAEEPFVHVDCSALSSTVIESELFGHERGAFTSADSRRSGRFELAGIGTIFLDEIGDLNPDLQAKLLRVLHDRAFERVGGTKTLQMKARVIAATSSDLRRAVQEGAFRADLYFRLAVAPISLAPLRERRGDIPLLVRSALGGICDRLDVPVPRLADSFYQRLTNRSWPGNVRELLNTLERCLIYHPIDELSAAELDEILEPEPRTHDSVPDAEPDPEPTLLDTSSRSRESKALIEQALVETGGNVSRAARRLGVHRGTLRHRIKIHGLQHLIPKD